MNPRFTFTTDGPGDVTLLLNRVSDDNGNGLRLCLGREGRDPRCEILTSPGPLTVPNQATGSVAWEASVRPPEDNSAPFADVTFEFHALRPTLTWADNAEFFGDPGGQLPGYYGFAALVARLLWSGGIGRIAALGFGFALAEWLRGFLFTGFPWNAIGYAAMPVPLLMQSVSVVGMVGMNALAVFVFALPALLAARRHLLVGATLGALIVTAHVGFGYFRLAQPGDPAAQSLDVRIVQPNVDLAEKWDASVRDRIFSDMMTLSAKAPEPGRSKPQLILWPETSVPFLFTERPEALAAIGGMLDEKQMLLAGIVREEGGGASGIESRYYNSVVAIDGNGEIVDAVDKVHLVPFGEYLPFADILRRFGLVQFVAGPMVFSAGNDRHSISLPGGVRALPFICYEVIFPDLVAVDAASTQLIVNVTNDAWFGDTPGPYQHFRQAQIRAVENGLPLLRAANNGISAVVDASGRIVDALGVNAHGLLDVHVAVEKRTMVAADQRRVNGFLAMLLLAFLAGALNVRQNLRVN